MLEVNIPLPYWFELAAILTGGLSASMIAVRARYDIFGCTFIACVGGMGGGILRDVLLQNYGIYAFQNPSLLLTCVIAAVVVFYFGKLATYLDPIVNLLDNTSIALWAIIGTGKTLSAGIGIVPAIMLGTLTAVGGGILRDTFMSRPVEAFKAGYFKGTAAVAGCTIYAIMEVYHIFPNLSIPVSIVVILFLRYGSLIFGWRTRPPRDYSDAVTHAVAKPVKFIARKAHVPMGKTERERQKRRYSPFIRKVRRIYRRITGKWMTAEANARAENTQAVEVDDVAQDQEVTKQTYVTINEPDVINVPTHMVHDETEEHGSAHPDESQEVIEVGHGPGSHSDRIHVDRDELRRIIQGHY